MSETYSSAVDVIFGAVNVGWSAGAAAITGYVPALHWEGIESEIEDGSKFWARVSEQIVDRRQTTHAEPARRFTVLGLVFIQIFCPKSDVEAVVKGRLLVELGQSVFTGKRYSGVVFRNVVGRKLEDENLYKRFNVVAEFEYDEVIGG